MACRYISLQTQSASKKRSEANGAQNAQPRNNAAKHNEQSDDDKVERTTNDDA